MQTGYDNFWMYQNSRHEPVHNLPKNDNYVYPILTDSYKQMQSGGCPSNTIVTPLNSIASSQNGQYNAAPHYFWPHSAYSLPYNSSYANNFHSQMFPTQTNNFNYSSQHAQPKTDVRNSVNVPQKNLGNNPKHVITRLPQNCADTENARIRVKDVFTLNNNSMYDNNLVETQKNKQYQYPLNYSANNCNRTCDFETNLPASQHLPTSFVQTEQLPSNNQQHIHQYSGTSYPRNAQISSSPGHVHSNGSKEKGSNFQSVGVEKKYHVLKHLLRKNQNQEVERNVCNSEDVNKTTAVKPNGSKNSNTLMPANSHISTEVTNSINYSSQVIENLNCQNSYSNGFGFSSNKNQDRSQSKNRVSFQEINRAPPVSQISFIEDLRKKQVKENLNKKDLSSGKASKLENNWVKITVPHTGQSTYLYPCEPSSTEKNCSLSLPCLLESAEKPQNYIQRNGSNSLPESGAVRRQNSNIPQSINQLLDTTIPGDSDYYKCPENTSKDFSTCEGNENTNELIENSPGTESNSNGETAVSDLTIKQEISNLEVENDSIEIDQNITMDQVFEEIKTENISENFEVEPQQQQSPDAEETHPSNPSSKDVDFNKQEKHSVASKEIPKPKIVFTECKQHEKNTSERRIDKHNFKKKSKTEKKLWYQKTDLNEPKKCIKNKNYVCKINRAKLDLLIQFLKKDDEATKPKTPDDEVTTPKNTDGCNKNKNELNMSCRRRKLSKTRIVKNKNNSREMVSLMSVKTSRTENQNSPNRNQISKPEGNPNPDSEAQQKELKYQNTSRETDKKKSEFEPVIENMSEGSQSQESLVDEEKNIVNIMQALQNLKSHFCLSCTLVSPIESFWINVASGELRCLNCFKKMTFKTEENIFKLKKTDNSLDKLLMMQTDDKKGHDNKKDGESETVCSRCSCKCNNEKPIVKSKQEEVSEDAMVYASNEERSAVHKNTEMKDVPRKKSTEEQKKSKFEEKSIRSREDFIPKTNPIEDGWKPENKQKRKLSLDFVQNGEEKPSLIKSRKKSYSEESHNCEKQSSDCLEKKNIREEIGSPKLKAHFDNVKRDKRSFSQSKEQKTSIAKDNDSEKLVKEIYSTEEDALEFGKKDKKHVKDWRKRSNSKDGFDLLKQHTQEGIVKKSTSDAKQSSKSKPKTTTSLLEDSEWKMPTVKMFEKEKSTESIDEVKKRRKSTEELPPRKIRNTEELGKFSKHSYEKPKTTSSTKSDDGGYKTKTPEYSKHIDSTSVAQKIKSKASESSDKDRRNSTSKENLSSPEHSKKKIKYESVTSGKEKNYCLGKIPKIPHKSSPKPSSDVYKLHSSDDSYQKATAVSKPLKESQRTEGEVKTSSPVHILKKKEFHENRHKQRELGDEKTPLKKRHDKPLKTFEGVDITERKKVSEQEPSKGHKNQTSRSKKDRALECIFGRRKEDLILNEWKRVHKDNPPSPKLLEKLIEKTKKLSWALLTKP